MKKWVDTPDIVYYNGEAVTIAPIRNHCPGRLIEAVVRK